MPVGSAVEWFTAITDLLVKIAGLALQGLWLWVLWGLFRPMLTQMLGGRSGSEYGAVPSSPKLMVRRLFCSHNGALARGRTRWGKVTTLCAKCGKDVNEGRPREEWR